MAWSWVRLIRWKQSIQRLERLIVETKKSLMRDLGERKNLVAQITKEARGRAVYRSGPADEWAESIDAALESRDRQIAELREPISGLKRETNWRRLPQQVHQAVPQRRATLST
ncbi:MAG: hypothetical protein U0Q16_24805 [Bryobacteraceae bacterium]